ncbi:MAG TPA: serine/threonine-protein kinase [Sandaracinaceae bacterium LLY-WYZ-13_1]|nr:serine/threonine-protein kinase [Sandaracinaceae bacterium LLY-WYZ-13_1]
MSQQRFIRCPHCGLPHEAEVETCPVGGEPIALETRARRRSKSPPSERSYAWAHSVHPFSGGDDPDADLEPADLDTFVGRVVEGKYRIEKLIGRGGMGAVFRAVNTRIDKAVALKVLYRGYARGSDAERRFLREARIAGSLGHPHIVEVFDLGHLDDGKPFQVMELLEGQSLAERIQTDGALPEHEVLEIADQVLSALEAAHERGVIHRDLKPENVFLTRWRGATVAKLLDFGVSKSLAEHTLSITRTGVVVGTPYYMSPEQARGQGEVDHRIDVWAMGVLLYEAVTGVLPFNAQSVEKLLTKILTRRPVAPTRFRARLTPEVEALILDALAFEPDDRPPSAAAMRARVAAARRAGLGRTVRDDPAPRWEEPEDATEVSDSFVSDELHAVVRGPDGGSS